MAEVNPGEIWQFSFPTPDRRRPVLVLRGPGSHRSPSHRNRRPHNHYNSWHSLGGDDRAGIRPEGHVGNQPGQLGYGYQGRSAGFRRHRVATDLFRGTRGIAFRLGLQFRLATVSSKWRTLTRGHHPLDAADQHQPSRLHDGGACEFSASWFDPTQKRQKDFLTPFF